jgi:hypothetical protein
VQFVVDALFSLFRETFQLRRQDAQKAANAPHPSVQPFQSIKLAFLMCVLAVGQGGPQHRAQPPASL